MSVPSLSEAYAVGRRHEETLDAAARRQGAHYTPPDVAELLVARSLDAWQGSPKPVVCDPTCGGGVFLVAAAEALVRRGASVDAVLGGLVVGCDLDPGAVAAARSSLEVWAAGHGGSRLRPRVFVADALEPDLAERVGPVDLVVGNPPFRNQLGSATSRTADERRALAGRFGTAAGGYVDVAALFELVGLDLVGPRGIVTLVQPRSFLVARDAEAVRRRLVVETVVRWAWIPGEPVFEAGVDVCAVVVERRGSGHASPVPVDGGRSATRRHGTVVPSALDGPTWSALWARAQGVPDVSPGADATTVGSVATATAGFRDQYYGLVAHLADDQPDEGARLATTAMIDPARCDWGTREVTVARRRRRAPWVDLAALRAEDERLAAWVDRLLVPKVLVATQTRVIEAWADHDGTSVPLTPLIAVVPRPGPGPDTGTDTGTGTAIGVGHLAAALTAPAATAWAMAHFGGGGMSGGALKLAARQVLDVPLPVHREPWDEAAALLDALRGADDGVDRLGSPDAATWRTFGRLMNAAWNSGDDVLEWWLDRLRPKDERRGVERVH